MATEEPSGVDAANPTAERPAAVLAQRAVERQRQFAKPRPFAAGHVNADELQSLQVEVRRQQIAGKRAKEELGSLREVYARQIANTEMKCERVLREKDDERHEWYKEKKYEIQKMQAGFVIVRALFESKRKKFKTQMEEDKADFERHKTSFRQETEMLKAESRALVEKAATELSERTKQFEEKISELSRERSELRDRVAGLEGQLADREEEVSRLEAEQAAQAKDFEEVKRRLQEALAEAEMARRNSRVEELEQELARTRRLMQDQAHREADALRRELMEYVKFIVHILPEDWQHRNLPVGDRKMLSPKAMFPGPPEALASLFQEASGNTTSSGGKASLPPVAGSPLSSPSGTFGLQPAPPPGRPRGPARSGGQRSARGHRVDGFG